MVIFVSIIKILLAFQSEKPHVFLVRPTPIEDASIGGASAIFSQLAWDESPTRFKNLTNLRYNVFNLTRQVNSDNQAKYIKVIDN